MKSTPKETQKCEKLKRLVVQWERCLGSAYPKVASGGVLVHANVEQRLDVVDYGEFFVVRTRPKRSRLSRRTELYYLRFRRRESGDGKHALLWHLWQPRYAATKPEMVDKVLPGVAEHLAALD